MKLIVDRIEGNFAVCEQEDKTTVNISLGDLPKEIREGSVLIFENGIYFVDVDEEESRRIKLFALQNLSLIHI